jgi:hypothetical protein
MTRRAEPKDERTARQRLDGALDRLAQALVDNDQSAALEAYASALAHMPAPHDVWCEAIGWAAAEIQRLSDQPDHDHDPASTCKPVCPLWTRR